MTTQAEHTKQVLEEIETERVRQIHVEGWTPEHDDEHELGEMAEAAACYAGNSAVAHFGGCAVPDLWPWEAAWWKPQNQRRDLIRAAALIVAEIERLDRAADSR